MGYGIFYEHLAGEAHRRGCSVVEMLNAAAAMGVDKVTLSDGNLPKALPHLEQTECKVNTVYCVCGLIHGEDIEKLRNAAQGAAQAGAQVLMAVPGFYREGQIFAQALQAAVPLLREAVRFCGDLGLDCAIENFGSYKTPYSLVPQIKEMLLSVEGLKFVYDTGNSLYHRQDPLLLWEETADRLAGIHIKDLSLTPIPGGKPLISPLGEALYPTAFGGGDLPSAALRERMKAANLPKERITFEHDGNGDPDTLQFLRNSLEFFHGSDE